jgi:hypothetical protein
MIVWVWMGLGRWKRAAVSLVDGVLHTVWYGSSASFGFPAGSPKVMKIEQCAPWELRCGLEVEVMTPFMMTKKMVLTYGSSDDGQTTTQRKL